MKITFEVSIEELTNHFGMRTKEDCDDTSIKPSEYARFFDENCQLWRNNTEENKYTLKLIQTNADSKLRAVGYLFLNDVYDMIGISRSKIGQLVGWVYENEDSYVDFSLYEGPRNMIMVDFNVDGLIIDKI
mgnify:CR=1 FL=1